MDGQSYGPSMLLGYDAICWYDVKARKSEARASVFLMLS
jgi:hypothetical protein